MLHAHPTGTGLPHLQLHELLHALHAPYPVAATPCCLIVQVGDGSPHAQMSTVVMMGWDGVWCCVLHCGGVLW